MFESAPVSSRGIFRRHLLVILVGSFFAIGLFLSALNTFLNTPPSSFPVEVDIEIGEGLTLKQVSEKLDEVQVIRSPLYLYLLLVQNYHENYVQAGTYRFPNPLSAQELAYAITEGIYRSPNITLTLIEGFRLHDMPAILPPAIDTSTLNDYLPYEGYLFPDTYYISEQMTLAEIISLLTATFDEKLVPFAEEIKRSSLTKEEIIILASILEREANDEKSMKIVSGILQERMRIGMPLQVDASLNYILNKTSEELTLDDLEYDSPYNTYEYKGLPPTPIANPGLVAIDAVLNPTESPYLYYLTAPDGTFYYAETFDEHKRNKERYLR